jgi:hypothetical protein
MFVASKVRDVGESVIVETVPAPESDTVTGVTPPAAMVNTAACGPSDSGWKATEIVQPFPAASWPVQLVESIENGAVVVRVGVSAMLD